MVIVICFTKYWASTSFTVGSYWLKLYARRGGNKERCLRRNIGKIIVKMNKLRWYWSRKHPLGILFHKEAVLRKNLSHTDRQRKRREKDWCKDSYTAIMVFENCSLFSFPKAGYLIQYQTPCQFDENKLYFLPIGSVSLIAGKDTLKICPVQVPI